MGIHRQCFGLPPSPCHPQVRFQTCYCYLLFMLFLLSSLTWVVIERLHGRGPRLSFLRDRGGHHALPSDGIDSDGVGFPGDICDQTGTVGPTELAHINRVSESRPVGCVVAEPVHPRMVRPVNIPRHPVRRDVPRPSKVRALRGPSNTRVFGCAVSQKENRMHALIRTQQKKSIQPCSQTHSHSPPHPRGGKIQSVRSVN